jgi:hypothetical protein
MAGFYCDLPVGIDERQLAGSKQENIEKIVYMIASGTGRARGSKVGGLQKLYTWRTVAIATGEEPISNQTSQTGVSTRVLEIYGGPFDNERDASLMHQQASQNYGWAGPEYIRQLLATDEQSIRDNYKEIQEAVSKIAIGISGAHISGISAVVLADALIEDWIFSPVEKKVTRGEKLKLEVSDTACKRAIKMAETIIKEQLAAGTGDVNERATQYVVDWILSNRQFFGKNVRGTCLGMKEVDEHIIYIYPSILNEVLTDAGYNYRKTLKYLADNDLIITRVDAKGKKESSIVKSFENKSCRFVAFKMEYFSKLVNSLNEKKDADTTAVPRIDEFEAIPDNIDLPF